MITAACLLSMTAGMLVPSGNRKARLIAGSILFSLVLVGSVAIDYQVDCQIDEARGEARTEEDLVDDQVYQVLGDPSPDFGGFMSFFVLKRVADGEVGVFRLRNTPLPRVFTAQVHEGKRRNWFDYVRLPLDGPRQQKRQAS